MNKIGEINGHMLFLNFLAVIVVGVLYRFVYVKAWHMEAPSWVGGVGFIILLAVVFLLMVMHELIHWAMATMMLGKGKARIKIRILVWECQVDAYLGRNQYIMYALAPGMIIGLIGLVVYYGVGQPDLRFIGALTFVVGASLGSGDYWFVYKTLKYPADSYVRDFGTRMEIFRDESAV